MKKIIYFIEKNGEYFLMSYDGKNRKFYADGGMIYPDGTQGIYNYRDRKLNENLSDTAAYDLLFRPFEHTLKQHKDHAKDFLLKEVDDDSTWDELDEDDLKHFLEVDMPKINILAEVEKEVYSD